MWIEGIYHMPIHLEHCVSWGPWANGLSMGPDQKLVTHVLDIDWPVTHLCREPNTAAFVPGV